MLPNYHSFLRANRTDISNFSIRNVGNTELVLDLSKGLPDDGTPILAYPQWPYVARNQVWNLVSPEPR